ncbi:MAG: class II aldolase/adducin family protein [Myxococcales bacterium]|nr:class II aldolase/adducin family protein [Myxococcales bacterium]
MGVVSGLSHPDARREIVAAGLRLDALRLVSGCDGNLSVRTPSGTLLVTPSGEPKGTLCVDQLVEVSLSDGQILGDGKPTSELDLHLTVYRHRPDIHAVVHAHAPAAIAASMQPDMRWDFAPEALESLRGVQGVDYSRPGTPELASGLIPYLSSNHCFLLAHHGTVTIGRTMAEALRRTENLEHNAKVALLALRAGCLPGLPDDELLAILAVSNRDE